jgi:CheY-like chemotaxis protein
LINLITNAVKFTRLESTRKIVVSIGASLTEPSSTPGGVEFISDKLVTEDSHLRDDWKRGSSVFIQFSVADTGRGLTDEEKSTLFARFSQASPRTHINYGGSGLGLFISRRLTELQGGSIGLASQSKKGSIFSFYIKARRTTATLGRRGSLPSVYPEDIKHRAHASKEADRAQNSTKPPPLVRKQSAIQTAIHTDIPSEVLGLNAEESFEELKRTKSIPDVLHVLVVEDNLVNQKVLANQLRNLGCVVSVANHGGEALDFLKKTQHWNHASTPSYAMEKKGPRQHTTTAESQTTTNQLPVDLSLILMDWEMPIMNGLTATIKIRQLEREGMLFGHVPVIGVTANVRQQQIETAMEAGMDDVVGKPFRVTELLGRMKGVVAGVVEDGGRVGGVDLESIREGEG